MEFQRKKYLYPYPLKSILKSDSPVKKYRSQVWS